MALPKKITVDDVAGLPAFCHATVAGDLVFVSGMLGTTGMNFALPESVAEQTSAALANIGKILEGAGSSFAHVCKVNVYLTDMSKFTEMNEAYVAFFDGNPPARITVGVAGLALGAGVEIDCAAMVA